ncbi:Mce-associated membrane protein [Mycobacterium sp. MAA66]|uniref:mammalian cell entry protein n=1 Tax=Mycobacterium sp. MAA66 TaxID=3156297 RepID=UPI003516CF93
MEDQQAESGDLSTEQSEADAPQGKAARHRHRLPRQKAVSVIDPQADDTATEGDDADTSVTADAEPATDETLDDPAGEASDAGEDTAAEVPTVPHQPVTRGWVVAGVVAGALFVGATAFGGAALQPYLADQVLTHNKFEVAKTAATAVSTLFSYTPQNMDALGARSQKLLSGRFAEEYQRFVDSIVATNKQAQVTNETNVVGAAVDSIGPDEATAIVYANSVATSPVSKNIPSLRYRSYRLTLQRQGSDWLVTRMPVVTLLDLTPQF